MRYFDGLTNDARLVIDTLRSAARHGAWCANYTRLEGRSRGRRAGGASVRDALTDRPATSHRPLRGQRHRPLGGRARHSSIRLRLTKGVHLVIDRRRLPVPDAVVMTDGQADPVRHSLGPAGDPGHDRHRLRRPAGRRADGAGGRGLHPGRGQPRLPAGPNRAQRDVLSTWAGLRPLIADGRVGLMERAALRHFPPPRDPHAAARLVRRGRRQADHLPPDRPAGGRSDRRPLRPADVQPCRTADEPLLDPAEAAAGGSGVLPPPFGRDVVRRLRKEWAVHLDDVLLRRTGWRHYLADADTVAQQVAAWMSP